MPAKNLGPFTGRQLTTIVVALIAAVMIPTGAYAVTAATRVVIEDKVTKTPAGVTPTGNLQVAEAAPSAFFQNGRTDFVLSGRYTRARVGFDRHHRACRYVRRPDTGEC